MRGPHGRRGRPVHAPPRDQGGPGRPRELSLSHVTTVAVIADTHMPRGARGLPDGCVERIRKADAAIHAGDFVTAAVLEEIESYGPPVHGVHGNVDEPSLRRRLPETLELELAGTRIGIVHDAGPSKGRTERLRAMFPDADCVVFGHSHLPEHRRVGSFQIFNPGSPTERRRAPRRSMGIMRIRGGVPSFRLVSL